MTNSVLKFFKLVMDKYVEPLTIRLEKQPHIAAIRDGFVTLIPFLTVGSLMLVLLVPPFSDTTTNGFGRMWLDFAGGKGDVLWRVFQMTFNAMALIASASIAYYLAKNHKRPGLPAAMLSLSTFLIVSAPYKDSMIDPAYLGGSGLFPAMFVAIYTVELSRLLDWAHIKFNLPKEVPEAVASSLNLLIPLTFVLLTLFPAVLFIEAQFGAPLPKIIMETMSPLVKASDSLGAIVLVVLVTHLLWFAGVNGSLIIMALWTPFLLTNLSGNFDALRTGEELPFIITPPFWDFYVVHGATGGLLALVILLLFSKSAHMRSIGKIGAVPAFFSIGEPVVFGLPIVMNPILFVPLILCPLVNAIIAYGVTSAGLVGRMYILVPWTTPAPIGAYIATGGDFRAALLSAGLIVLDIAIYYPFFKALERHYLKIQIEH